MAREISVAPKERVNIVYRSQTGDVEQDVELPLKLLVMGDFKSSKDDTPLEDRKPESINQNNFNNVLKAQKLHLDLDVPDEISGDEDIVVSLDFNSMKDFEPDAIIENDKSLNKLQQLRDALVSLKSSFGINKKVTKLLQEFQDNNDIQELLSKLETNDEEDK
jgi:type VI secretion system protein ImpB